MYPIVERIKVRCQQIVNQNLTNTSHFLKYSDNKPSQDTLSKLVISASVGIELVYTVE